jgi:hypothetical protein
MYPVKCQHGSDCIPIYIRQQLCFYSFLFLRLLQGMGSEQFSDLVPWLMATLASEGSAVERSGAAQV